MQMKIIVVIILAFSLLGCSTLPSDQSNSSDLLVRKKLIGKWQCYPKDKEAKEFDFGEVETLMFLTIANTTQTRELQLSASLKDPADNGTIAAKWIDEYSLQAMQMNLIPKSGEVNQLIEPKFVPLQKLFKPYLMGMTMGMEWRLKDKMQQSVFIESIDEVNLRIYKLDIQGNRFEQISCNRL
jgi:hypothetical protein